MNIKKIGLFASVLFLGAATLSSCTRSFCTVTDNASTLYSYEKYEEGKTYADGTKTKEIVDAAKESGLLTPSAEFNAFIESKIVEEAKYLDENVYTAEKGYDKSLFNLSYARGVALFAGGEDRNDIKSYTLWYNFDKWVEEARSEIGLDKCPDRDYITTYKSSFGQLISNRTTCISPETRSYNGVVIEGTSWGEAFGYGPIEGLLVYPVSWLIYTFSNAFSGIGGVGTLLAILLVTLIVRGVLILATFKQTLSQQKMTQLQPEMAKLQAKYPQANTNNYEKQKLTQEQMALWKKHGVNPFGTLIIMIFQFPIFIAVWSAMSGSAILMEGEIFGLSFATVTSTALVDFSGPWYVAWIIFLLMAVSQFLSMKLPQWRQKKIQNQTQKLGKNPAQDQQTKTMKMVSNVMLIMIIIMGLSLPIAMEVYWFATALISLGQTILTQKISENASKKAKFAKYKTK